MIIDGTFGYKRSLARRGFYLARLGVVKNEEELNKLMSQTHRKLSIGNARLHFEEGPLPWDMLISLSPGLIV